MNINVLVGTTAHFSHVVVEENLATNWENDVPVLATPVLAWLAELASIKVLGETLDDELMTVGVSYELEHLAPTPVGFTVILSSTLVQVEGNILIFSIIGSDNIEKIVLGHHKRAIINKNKFIDKVIRKNTP